MAGSQVLADKIIGILLAANDILVGQDALNGVLTIAENEKNKVIIASQMLSNYSYNNEGVSSLLSLLGGKFVEIAERRKHPVIENNAENVALLSRLENIGFISSKTPEKDGLRVHPKRS